MSKVGMGPPTLFLYIIHRQSLTRRALQLHGVIQQLRVTASKQGFQVKPYLILKNDAPQIAEKVADYQNRITYDVTGDPEFDKHRQPLGTEAISNIEKHRDAWLRIYDAPSHHPNDMFMVMEDDTFLLPEGQQNFAGLLDALPSMPIWDILFLGIVLPVADPKLSILPLKTTVGKILPSKSCYFIRQQTAKRMLDIDDKLRYPMRLQLSYIFDKNKDIRAMHVNQPIILDGSKIGITPSAIHPNNLLIMNREYMDLLSFLTQDTAVVQKELNTIRAIYKNVKHMNSPDIMHLFGVLLFKCGKITDAEEMLSQAAEAMKEQHGLLDSRSDLMNNLIMVYQQMQQDLPHLLSATSQYDSPEAAEPSFE